jgi:DNA transformation protein
VALSASYRDYLAELLAPVGKFSTKRVFGLDGIMADGILLGFVIDERIHFRTDAASVAAYRDGGGKPFTFAKANGEHIITSYYSLPERLYDEPDELVRWARLAREAALQSPSARARDARRTRRALSSATKSKGR